MMFSLQEKLRQRMGSFRPSCMRTLQQLRLRLDNLFGIRRTILLVINIAVLPILTAFVVLAGLSFGIDQIIDQQWYPWTWVVSSSIGDGLFLVVLGAIGALSVAVLTLYFTAVSVVVSTSYSRASPALRDLLLQDAVGSNYSKIVAHVGVFSFIALAQAMFTQKAYPAVAVYSVVGGCSVLLALFPLGTGILRLFDPAKLASQPMLDFMRWARASSCDGWAWAEPSLQLYYGSEGAKALRALEDAVKYTLSESSIRTTTVASVTRNLLQVVGRYNEVSSSIPSDSLWFPRMGVFQSWETSSSLDTEIAIATGTIPDARRITDHCFLERRVAGVVKQAISVLLTAGAYPEVSSVLYDAQMVIGELCARGDIRSAEILFSGLEDVVSTQVLEASDITDDNLASVVAAFNVLAVNYSAIPVGIVRGIDRWTSLELLDSMSVALGNRTRKGLYKALLPREVLIGLENAYSKRSFEPTFPAQQPRPRSIVRESVALVYAKWIESVCLVLAERSKNYRTLSRLPRFL